MRAATDDIIAMGSLLTARAWPEARYIDFIIRKALMKNTRLQGLRLEHLAAPKLYVLALLVCRLTYINMIMQWDFCDAFLRTAGTENWTCVPTSFLNLTEDF